MTSIERVLLAFAVLQILITTGAALASEPQACARCIGVVSDLEANPEEPLPLLVRADSTDLDRPSAYLDALSIEQKKNTVVIISGSLQNSSEPLQSVESEVAGIVSWLRVHGPFAAVGISLPDSDVAIEGYALKRFAVTTQGLGLAGGIVYGPAPLERITRLYETGSPSYVDAFLVQERELQTTSAWLLEKDPAKKIDAIVAPSHPNVAYDGARAVAAGAETAFIEGPLEPATLSALARIDQALVGDYAPDPSSRIVILNREGSARDGSAVAFIRGEDLRTLVFPSGDTTQWSILSLPGSEFTNPRRVDAKGTVPTTDTGTRDRRFLVGLPPTAVPFAVLLDRPKVTDQAITREAIDVTTARGITVEEIIRNHQAYRAYQDTIQLPWIAEDTTHLRFSIGAGTDAIEATIQGPYFYDPSGKSDWVWRDFLINGVKWKYGRIPELPIIQAEKVTQLPLDLHLTNDYRYQLVGSAKVLGYDTWELRFEPPREVPEDLPLYRGTVWIDKRTWSRVRMSMVQLNLHSEVLSNEERIDYAALDRHTGHPVGPAAHDIDAKDLLWLPVEIHAQQVVSAAGRVTPVLRETIFSDLRLDPPDFEESHREASASSARMVRETEAGLRYLDKDPSGNRVVREKERTSRTFLAAGLHHDAGLEFPVVPLGGFDYFNYNLHGTGLQTNVFFAGVILAANLTDPTFRGTRTDLGADFFGIAVPFENIAYRDGSEIESEAVKSLPISLVGHAGHPFFGFGKAELSLSASRISYQRSDTTAPEFVIPEDTFELVSTLSLRYDRWGYSAAAHVSHGTRTNWKAWGRSEDYDPAQKSFERFGLTLGKTLYLPGFQRIGLELNYLDGRDLDRFSKYELGFFGAQRVHGIKSGSVRAERAVLGHLSYGFVFSKQFRLEAFYDHALIDDAASGFSREPFQGIGIGGQTIGPWGTLIRLDIGKTVGSNAQDDFVANVIFLKLFG